MIIPNNYLLVKISISNMQKKYVLKKNSVLGFAGMKGRMRALFWIFLCILIVSYNLLYNFFSKNRKKIKSKIFKHKILVKSPKPRNEAQKKVNYKNYNSITMSRSYQKKLSAEIISRNYQQKLSAKIMTQYYELVYYVAQNELQGYWRIQKCFALDEYKL